MVQATRANKSTTQQNTTPAKSKTMVKTIKDDHSTDSSDEEIDSVIAEALKGYLSRPGHDSHDDHVEIDVDSDSESDEDTSSSTSSSTRSSDTESSDSNSQTVSFIVDKGADERLLSFVPDTVDPKPSGSKQTSSDNRGVADDTSEFRDTTTKSREGTPLKRYEVITRLDPGIDTSDIYVNVNAFETPEPSQKVVDARVASQGNLLKGSVLDSEFEKKLNVPPYEESLHQLKKQRRIERSQTNGRGWFNMPVQEMTDAKKNDLMVLQMRRALDPKHFYKAPDIRAMPKFFQMGRVVEGPADFYHSRIPKKQRKATLVDELLADVEFRKYNKRKYTELVEQRKGSSAAYKHMKKLKKRKK